MLRLYQVCKVITLRFDMLDDAAEQHFLHATVAVQNPKILAIRFAHDGPTVTRVQVDNPVIAVERPEESHLELAARTRLRCDLRHAISRRDSPIRRSTLVHHGDLSRSEERR